VADQPDKRVDPHEERRIFNRSRLIVDVFYDGSDATGVASTKDISFGGLYMNTQAAIPEGKSLMIRISFSSGQEVVCNAKVIYSNPGLGVGIRFEGLTTETRSTLERELKNDR